MVDRSGLEPEKSRRDGGFTAHSNCRYATNPNLEAEVRIELTMAILQIADLPLVDSAIKMEPNQGIKPQLRRYKLRVMIVRPIGRGAQ